MGMMSSIGGMLNDITGASSAAAQSQKYALQSAAINNQYQKEFAQNAHQWEIEDLKKAGLNPILSAGGSGTSASGGGVASATETSAGISPFDALSAGVSAYTGIQNGKQMASEAANLDANTLLTKVKTQMEALHFAIESKLSETTIKQRKTELEKTLNEVALLETGSLGQKIGTKRAKAILDGLEEGIKGEKGKKEKGFFDNNGNIYNE